MAHMIVEDGTGKAGATSYVSLAEADAYFQNHPYYADAWEELGEPDKERYLVSATMSLDTMMRWLGVIRSPMQALGWPRSGVVDHEGRTISNTAVPKRVKDATCELAFHHSKGDPFAPQSSQGLEALKIDVIELQFSQSSAPAPVPAAALALVTSLGAYAFGSRIRKVLVG